MVAVTARGIRTGIESRIASGDLAAGDRLPSVRDLAAELGVSPATVSAAYRELRLRGLVSGKGRQGTSVTAARRIDTALSPMVPDGLIDAMNGSPDTAYLPALGPALAFAASAPQLKYGGALIEPTLADAAAELFAADGISHENITVTSGAMDAVERVLRALDLRIGDRVGVEDPGHIPVHQLARSSGLELVPLQVDEKGITAPALGSALERGLSAVIVTPRAHNPTGAALTESRAAQLSNLLADHPTTALVLDDHAGLISGVPYHPVLTAGPRWATMRSLGKSFGPDMRLALVTGDDQTMHRVTTGLSNGPGWVSFILQRAAAFLLQDPDTRSLLDAAATSYAHRRNHLITRLGTHGVASSGASGLNVWIPTTREQATIDAARLAGYAIRSGAPYQLRAARAVRVTISNLAISDIETIADAVGEVHQNRSLGASM